MMRAFDLFTDVELSRELAACASRERTSIAEFIACIEEFDRRRLYVPAGYASLYLYCVGELGLSEDAACMRIRAARAARKFPVLIEMLEDGRLHLTGVSLLASHLTPANVDELLRSSVGKGKRAIAELIAARFPESELLPLIEAVPAATSSPIPPSSVTIQADLSVPERINIGPLDQTSTSSERRTLDAPAPSSPAVIRPIAQERYSVHITVSKTARDKLEYAQALLSHSIPSGDLAEVFERALDSLIKATEKKRFADVENPRTSPGTHGRTIPAEVRRAVWRRDEGRCTFVGDDGHRCDEWRFLEFDHVDPVAFGGLPMLERVRLRCRAHNQYEAEGVFGREFMDRKRIDGSG